MFKLRLPGLVFLMLTLFFSKGYAAQSPMLSYTEVMMMKSTERVKYFRSISKLMILMSPRPQKQKTVFELLFPEVYAMDSFHCIGGGVPVPAGQSCGVQSYAGFSCLPGYEICNPLLFGVKPDKTPFCYKDATTELCYKNIVPGKNSVMDPVFANPANEAEYTKFANDINNICYHIEKNDGQVLANVTEKPKTLKRACEIVRRQTQINRQRQLVGYVSEGQTPCTGLSCARSSSSGGGSSTSNPEPGVVAENCEMKLGDKTINCNSRSLTQRSWDGVRKMVCLYERSSLNFCASKLSDKSSNSIDGYLDRIQAAADVLDLDPRQLACMTLIESSYVNGAGSSAGAKGLTQFMPATATQYQKRIQNDPTLKLKWREFQNLTGEGIPVNFVTAENIRGGAPSYGIFAMGAFLKDTIHHFEGDLSEEWLDYLVGGGDSVNLFHAQIAAYNWKPNNIDNFTNYVLQDRNLIAASNLPNETVKFMNKFNQCMYTESGWAYAGVTTPSSSRQQACKIHENNGICAGDVVSEEFFEEASLSSTDAPTSVVY